MIQCNEYNKKLSTQKGNFVNTVYGAFIMFFYFIKYPIVIYLGACYFYLDMPSNFIMDILGAISVALILKDIFFPHQKPDNCSQ